MMHIWLLTLFTASVVGVSAAPPDTKSAPTHDPIRGDRFFYLPTPDAPATPATWGFRYVNTRFKSSDGTELHGWLIHGRGEHPKGTVVFSHGAAGAMGYHLGFVMWLAEAGYHVLMFDYRGYGQSNGNISRLGMVHDVRAALRFAASHPQLKSRPIVSYGHSLGAAKSVAALAGPASDQVKAVIIDASFASYRTMAHRFAGRIGQSLVSDDLSPLRSIATISPTPLLVIHGKLDPIVPLSEARRLFQAAGDPKTLHLVEQGGHGNSLSRDDGAHRQNVLNWLDAQLANER